jgi:hypothetical protein
LPLRASASITSKALTQAASEALRATFIIESVASCISFGTLGYWALTDAAKQIAKATNDVFIEC